MFEDGKDLIFAFDCDQKYGGCGTPKSIKMIAGPAHPKPFGYCMNCGQGFSVSNVANLAQYTPENSGTTKELFSKYRFDRIDYQPKQKADMSRPDPNAAPAPQPVPAIVPPPAQQVPPPPVQPSAPLPPPPPVTPSQLPPPPPPPPPVQQAVVLPPPPAPVQTPSAVPASNFPPPPPPPEMTQPAAKPVLPPPPVPTPAQTMVQPENGSTIIANPAVASDFAPTAKPPFPQAATNLEDAGEIVDDKKISKHALLSTFKSLVPQIIKMAEENQSSGNTVQSVAPVQGNPFKEEGTFAQEHRLFNALIQGRWVAISELVAICGGKVAEKTVAVYVKSLGGLAGYKLDHHKESNSYILSRA